ncbi:TetR family transcriptional regulator [Actinomadura parmotrematis]|uniref:TetR family transcriptional regulator n=1 Tax=Actinomadura parmotrematis TaxID=2864039 RepID=A0ABS7FV02_9ACTN|nr:TetR family transcriptional regulator [Actinomadura parmotrematis]MBW8484250.1 TetR family transcriptional regulator [Actinomadura parmotrematis]
MTAVPDPLARSAPAGGDAPPASGRALAGLRERKKQRTRTALVDAALDLFLDRGYDATTIDEIVAAVEVSQRTFFRYFATKEDVVAGFLGEFDAVMAEALAARPPGERPFTALLESLRAVLWTIAESGEHEAERFRRVRQVIERTPALAAAEMARFRASEERLAGIVARREGVDSDTDLRPRVIVAFYAAASRIAFEDCARREIDDPAVIAARVEGAVALAGRTLRDWI